MGDERMTMPDSCGKHQHCHRLMRQRQTERHMRPAVSRCRADLNDKRDKHPARRLTHPLVIGRTDHAHCVPHHRNCEHVRQHPCDRTARWRYSRMHSATPVA